MVFAFMVNIIAVSGSHNHTITYNADKDSGLSISLTTTALAQTINSNKTQLWIDKENNAKITFTYNLENPIIGKPTKLLFSVQDLLTGDELKEALHARIIITKDARSLKLPMEPLPGEFLNDICIP
jgi:hypothetical protein